MFAGLSRSEQNVLLGLLFCGFFLGIVYSTRDRVSAVEATVYGAAVHHPPGVLSLSGASGGVEPEEGASYLRDGRVDLNRAPAEVLASALPGIGPVRAETIVRYRERHGPFRQVGDLIEVSGIGEKTMEALEPLLFVEVEAGVVEAFQPPGVFPVPVERGMDRWGDLRPVNINTASTEELETLPGVGPVIAERIVEYRRLHGPFRTVHDLERVSGIGPRTLETLRPRITTTSPSQR